MREIPDFPGYFADTSGNIYSTRSRWSDMKLHKLSPGHVGRGYLQVGLRLDGKTHYRHVHRLILETFIGPCPDGMECCHGERGVSDNSLSNLSWGTRSKNNGADQVRDGTRARGERAHRAKLKNDQVKAIRSLRGKMSQTAIAKKYGVSPATVWYIHSRKTWVDL